MVVFLIVALSFYLLIVFFVFKISNAAQVHIENHLTNQQSNLVKSIGWAWLSRSQILSFQMKWGRDCFGDILKYEHHRLNRVWLPNVALMMFLVLFYQYFIRRGGPFNLGRCSVTPNCSNFAIGCILRYSTYRAINMTITRIDCCHAGQPDSYSSSF